MANFGTDAFVCQKFDEVRKTVNLALRAFVRCLVEHVGSGEMGEHTFHFEMLQGQNLADCIEVVKAYPVTMHARVDGEVCLTMQIVFFEILVESHRGLQVGKGGSQLEFDEVREIGRNAGTEDENRKIHAVLAEQHAFGKVRDAQKIRPTVFSSVSAGQRTMTVAICFHGKENLCLFGNGFTDKLNIARESVQVDFDPIRARNTVQIRRKLCQIHSIQNID